MRVANILCWLSKICNTYETYHTICSEATIKAIDDDYDVVMWEKHGVFAVDTDIMSAFDQVDVLNKAALIYIASKNMGFEPEGMSDAQMKELSDTFGLPK